MLDGAALLVNGNVAAKQRAEDLEEQCEPAPGIVAGADTPSKGGADNGGTTSPTHSLPKRFYGSATLDPTRIGRDAGRIAEEVIAHLTAIEGAKVEVTIDIQANIPSGVEQAIVRAVSENCRTLKFEAHGFEK